MDLSFSSGAYWETRYRVGGSSGAGSYGRLAHFKSEFINAFVADNEISSVLDLGCGDGNLLSLLLVADYVGVDASPTAVARCAARFADHPDYRFLTADRREEMPRAELAMSIDVIFHLIEDAVFARHLADLFEHSTRCVLIYASNHDSTWPDRHVRHRRFTEKVAEGWPEWRLLAHVPNRFPYDRTRTNDTSFADFFVYGHTWEPCVIRLPAA